MPTKDLNKRQYMGGSEWTKSPQTWEATRFQYEYYKHATVAINKADDNQKTRQILQDRACEML